MKIFLPENIFAKFLCDFLNVKDKKNVVFKPSALLTKFLHSEENSIALIPTLEIITNRELFISHTVGISFGGSLCNSFIYYNNISEELNNLKLVGDVSSMEVILSKILFKELYNTDVQINIQTKTVDEVIRNFISIGDENFVNERFKQGISFSEEMIEILSTPFVNYVLASKDENTLSEVSARMTEKIKSASISEYLLQEPIPEESRNFIGENFPKVFYSFDEQDIEGINQLIRLPFYYDMIKDIIDVKFV